MKTYTIRGEHGIQFGDNITLEIEARTEQSARNKFIKLMKKEYPVYWKRMGEHNIYVENVKEKTNGS